MRGSYSTRAVARLAGAFWLALALGGLALGGAWYAELALGYAPCALCLTQRWPYYAGLPLAALGIGLAAAGRGPARLRWLAGGLGLLFLASAGLGAHHAGVEWGLWAGPAGCGGRAGAAAPAAGALLDAMAGARVVACDAAPARVLGLSFAGWNALVSLVVGVVSLLAALRRERF